MKSWRCTQCLNSRTKEISEIQYTGCKYDPLFDKEKKYEKEWNFLKEIESTQKCTLFKK